MDKIDFQKLKEENKTVIYKELDKKQALEGWEFWGTRESEKEKFFVYRKIVSFEEAEKYEMTNTIE